MERRDFLRSVAAGGVGLGLAAAQRSAAAAVAVPAPRTIRVLVWDEQQDVQVKSGAYKNFLGNAVAEFLSKTEGLEVTSANLNEPEQGLSEDRIKANDVFVWWGHQRHKDVSDSKVESIVAKVKAGKAGFVALHSAHYSKPFKALMGTDCGFRVVRVENNGKGSPEHLVVTNPNHPIAKGLKNFDVPQTEIYGEPFEVPMPETIVLYGHWESGPSFPSCAVWTVGPEGPHRSAKEQPGGRVAYFRPGHETFPIFHQKEVQQVVSNAVLWAAPRA